MLFLVENKYTKSWQFNKSNNTICVATYKYAYTSYFYESTFKPQSGLLELKICYLKGDKADLKLVSKSFNFC